MRDRVGLPDWLKVKGVHSTLKYLNVSQKYFARYSPTLQLVLLAVYRFIVLITCLHLTSIHQSREKNFRSKKMYLLHLFNLVFGYKAVFH